MAHCLVGVPSIVEYLRAKGDVVRFSHSSGKRIMNTKRICKCALCF